MRKSKTAVIIISAGYSSRMNSFKPFLEFNHVTAIERLIHTYRSSGITDIYVVIGHRQEEMLEHLKGLEVTTVFNESYALGMFTSIKKGIGALHPDIDAYFVQPVDIPLIKRTTIELLLNNDSILDKGILYPTFCNKKGHPPLIDCKYNDKIIVSNGDGGLKRILEEFKAESVCVPVFDQAILMDMDKKEDYDKLVLYDSLNAPNRDECLAILTYYKTPEHIIRHCEAVEKVAHTILCEVNSYCIDLNEYALLAAALLHDIARREKNHATAGADMIREIGYPFVGEMIASHMDIEVSEQEPLKEQEILYLADKLVIEDRNCRLDDRFKQALSENKDNLIAIKKINQRWNAARDIINKIEKLTGKGFDYDKNYISDSSWEN